MSAKIKIIPAIDILNGQCVRLTQGDFSTQKIYNHDALEVAKAFEAAGMKYLHLVDLDGAKAGKIINQAILEQIARGTSLSIDFSGGLRSEQDIRVAFESGAAQVALGSVALRHPERVLDWLSVYGAEAIILSADTKNRQLAVQGWQEQAQTDILDFIASYYSKGISCVACTDIEKDGMLQGVSLELYREILDAVPVRLIASGGVASIGDIYALDAIGCHAVIIGKAIYENQITLSQLQDLC